MFSFAHALTVNNKTGKKQKQKQKTNSKSDSIRIRHIREQILFNIWKSPKAWAWSDKSIFLSIAQVLRPDLKKLLSNNILKYMQRTRFIVQPRNSCDIHMIKPKNASGLHPHEPIWRSSGMYQYSDIFSRTQQHYKVHNVYPNFQVKASGAHDTWHKTIGHPLTATRAQEFYK